MVIEFSSLLFFIIIFSYAGIITLINYNKNKVNYKGVFLNLCIFLSLLFIISETLFPIRLGVEFEGFEIYNLIPLKVPYDIYQNHSFPYFVYQVVGNIVLFVPFGYFVYLRTNKNQAKTLLIAFLTTLTVEIIQGFIPYRFCDIDDLWLNTLGAFIGIIVCKIFNRSYTATSIKKERI